MTADLLRQRVEDWAAAIRARDINRVMSLYASSIVSFDLEPPLQYSGTDNKRRAWEAFFATHTGTIGYELRKVDVTTNGELAFVRSLNRVSGTLTTGRNGNLWVRWTACFQKLDGVWLVVHDHVSIPEDKRGVAPQIAETGA